MKITVKSLLKFFETKKSKSERVPLPKRDMGILIKDYKIESWLLRNLANRNLGKVPEEAYADLKKIENEIIEQLPDPLQREVFKIFAQHKFDIVDLIPGWKEEMKKVSKEVCHYLHYGSPFPNVPEWPPLPLPGNVLFLWMLEEAKEEEGKKRYYGLSLFFKKAKEDGEIFGFKISEEELQNISGRLIVIFSGQWAKHSAVLLDILCQVEGGEDFVKEILEIQE
jgi:hypothetical protein